MIEVELRLPIELIAHTDGGSRQTGAAYAAIIDRQDRITGEPMRIEVSGFLGKMTNNEAEYHGLIAALEYAVHEGADFLTIKMDSELVVKQMNGQYGVSHPRMKPLYQQACELRDKIPSVQIGWVKAHVPGTINQLADDLVNKVLDANK